MFASPARAQTAATDPADNPQNNKNHIQPSARSEGIAALQARVQTLIAAGKATQALDLLIPYETAYDGNPDFDYLLGTTALAAGKNTVAVNAFERVVLVQPSYAGAWLDLAIAHFKLGETDTADRLLVHIEDNFDTPQNLRTEITEVRRKILRDRLTRGWKGDLSLWAGHTNNANYGLAVSSLKLTLEGDVPVSLVLDPSYRPRSDNFAEFRGNASRTFIHADGDRSDVYGSLRTRLHGTETAQNFYDATASWIYRAPIKWQNTEGVSLFGGTSVRQLNYDQRSASSGMLSGGLRFPVRGCHVTTRADLERRSYSNGGIYDATVPWIGVGAECSDGDFFYAARQRFGWDMANATRPGGDSQRAETLLFARWQARPDLQLDAILYYARSRDADTYSPLLANGDQRWVNRLGQKLEATWVAGQNRSPWAVVAEFEHITDRSNIGLSSLKLVQFMLGLSYRYF